MTISESNDYGLYLYGASSGALSVRVDDITSRQNLQHAVFVDDDSTGAFTIDLGGGALGSTGGNRFFGSVIQDIRADMDNGQLKAENNWWGSASGLVAGEMILDGTSTIDSAPFLAIDPGN